MSYHKSVTGREYSRVKRRIHASARKYNRVCESSVNIVILYRDEIIEEIVHLNLELIKIKFNFWCVCVCASSITMKAMGLNQQPKRDKFLIYINEKQIISINISLKLE